MAGMAGWRRQSALNDYLIIALCGSGFPGLMVNGMNQWAVAAWDFFSMAALGNRPTFVLLRMECGGMGIKGSWWKLLSDEDNHCHSLHSRRDGLRQLA